MPAASIRPPFVLDVTLGLLPAPATRVERLDPVAAAIARNERDIIMRELARSAVAFLKGYVRTGVQDNARADYDRCRQLGIYTEAMESMGVAGAEHMIDHLESWGYVPKED